MTNETVQAVINRTILEVLAVQIDPTKQRVIAARNVAVDALTEALEAFTPSMRVSFQSTGMTESRFRRHRIHEAVVFVRHFRKRVVQAKA